MARNKAIQAIMPLPRLPRPQYSFHEFWTLLGELAPNITLNSQELLHNMGCPSQVVFLLDLRGHKCIVYMLGIALLCQCLYHAVSC